MKKVILILSVIFALYISADAQVRWPFGNANSITVTSDDTIDISASLQRGLNYIDFNTDTNIVFQVSSMPSSLKIGDYLIIEATEAGVDADTLTYGTGITGAADAIPSDKTRVVKFVFNGTAWVKESSTQID